MQIIWVNELSVIWQELLQIVTILDEENPWPFIVNLRPPAVLPLK